MKADALPVARETAGGKYVAILVPGTAKKALEILVHVTPVLLGDGVRLFEQPGSRPVRLEPVNNGPEVTSL